MTYAYWTKNKRTNESFNFCEPEAFYDIGDTFSYNEDEYVVEDMAMEISIEDIEMAQRDREWWGE